MALWSNCYCNECKVSKKRGKGLREYRAEESDNEVERIAISPSSLQAEYFQGYPIELCAQILLIMEYAKMSIPLFTDRKRARESI